MKRFFKALGISILCLIGLIIIGSILAGILVFIGYGLNLYLGIDNAKIGIAIIGILIVFALIFYMVYKEKP